MPIYQTTSKVNRAPAEGLVVRCSDHRFRAGFREFLEKGLNLSDNYDLLVIPGGPQLLTLVEYLPKFAWVGNKWFRFLIENHSLRRLILIAHQDCGWYKDLPFHLHTSSNPRARQEEDLRRAHRALTRDFPQIHVELYYAGWDSSEKIVVESVAA